MPVAQAEEHPGGRRPQEPPRSVAEEALEMKTFDLRGTGSVVGMFEEMVKDGVEYAGIAMTAEELRTAALDLMKRTMAYGPPDDHPKYAGAVLAAAILKGKGLL